MRADGTKLVLIEKELLNSVSSMKGVKAWGQHQCMCFLEGVKTSVKP